jgi:hypothetical protein
MQIISEALLLFFKKYLFIIKIFYNSVIEEYNYTKTSDTIKYPKSNEPYTNAQLEQHHFIDVSENGDGYFDLLFTVVKFKISGINGDYIKLGPGNILLLFYT